MCGICGFMGPPDRSLLERMMRRLHHRGPDEEGMHADRTMSLGIRRLRVIDPKGGRQPMTNETGTVWIVLNGEIYNYRELREELVRKGHRFTTVSDTEVLVHLYEEEGEAGIQRLRGMFAYALWDQTREMLWLVRDRFGIKPLYYTTSESDSELQVVFASELPALLSACRSSSLRPQAIADYLTLLYVPGPGTIFDGVLELPPGHLLKATKGTFEISRYTKPAGPSTNRPVAQGLEGQFRNLLKDSVRAHLVSDVPLGLFLSGGLDSSSILAMMRQVTDAPIRTFSIGYESVADRSYNELEAARALASRFETQHTEEVLRPDAVKVLSEVVTAMGEPFADVSAIPTFLVSQVARRSVTVALSGVGGDELFGGYPRYMGIRLAGVYRRLPRAVRQWTAWLAAHLPESTHSRDQLGRVKRFLRTGHEPLAAQYVRWITFTPIEWGPSMFTAEFRRTVSTEDVPTQYAELFDAWDSNDPADRAMGVDLQTYLSGDLLRMGDRLSMAHSLELRVPFCDADLVEFALSLPSSMRFAGGTLKGFMRRALRGVLPSATLRGAKLGFQVPLARWLREDLSEVLRDMLCDDAIRRRGILCPAYVRWLVTQHQSGMRNCTDQLYALLVFEMWHASLQS